MYGCQAKKSTTQDTGPHSVQSNQTAWLVMRSDHSLEGMKGVEEKRFTGNVKRPTIM